MPIAYVIEIADRTVRARAWGELCNSDLRDYHRALAADARFRPDFRNLVNLEAVQVFALDSRVIADVAAWSVFGVGVRRAFVAPSDVAFGLARMFSQHAESVGQNVVVFRTELAAELWLASPTEEPREPGQLPQIDYMRVA